MGAVVAERLRQKTYWHGRQSRQYLIGYLRPSSSAPQRRQSGRGRVTAVYPGRLLQSLNPSYPLPPHRQILVERRGGEFLVRDTRNHDHQGWSREDDEDSEDDEAIFCYTKGQCI